jgi:hypothetical protein
MDSTDLELLKSIHHLARYAAFAAEPWDTKGASFRRHAPDLQKSEIFEAGPSSFLTQKSRVHLGIRHDNTLVTVFSNYDSPWLYEDLLIRPTSMHGFLSYVTTDFRFGLRRIEWPWGPEDAWVHEHFLLIFDMLRDDLVEHICALLAVRKEDIESAKPQKVEVCGHGLGGALATLCALWCATLWPDAEITCVTLGSPKVGNKHFADEFRRRSNVRCYRLVMESDPFSSMPYGDGYRGAPTWQHVGKEICIPRYEMNHKASGILEEIFHMAGDLSEVFIDKVSAAAEAPVVYLGLYFRFWMFYWLLKGCQLLLTVSVHGPRVYITSFQGLVETIARQGGVPK